MKTPINEYCYFDIIDIIFDIVQIRYQSFK